MDRAGSSPHLADAGAESPVAGGGDGGAMRCSAALKVGFAATAFAGSLGYFVLLMYALGLSVVMADGAHGRLKTKLVSRLGSRFARFSLRCHTNGWLLLCVFQSARGTFSRCWATCCCILARSGP